MSDTPKTGPTEQSVDAFLAQVEPPLRQADGITLRQFYVSSSKMSRDTKPSFGDLP